MEGLTRLVSESMARHGFDRTLDYRRLHWSHWFRCESPHSLLFVPSKPGVFALAEEIRDFGDAHGGAAAPCCPAEQSSVGSVGAASAAAGFARNVSVWDRVSDLAGASEPRRDVAGSTHAPTPRMLAVTQFFEDDDMAFVLDRMLSSQNPMRARLVSGRYFVRFVVIEDQPQRRTICNALNQWMVTAAEKATGIGSHFATSLELTPANEYVPPANDAQQVLFESDDHGGRTLLSAHAASVDTRVARTWPERESKAPSPASLSQPTAPQLDSGAATNIHCPSPFPSGF
ncbi:MAG TPA: hypothetical protein VIH75_24850 [Candidatus Sulfotelmatobacter sp.]|jgi:hypothetical protein